MANRVKATRHPQNPKSKVGRPESKKHFFWISKLPSCPKRANANEQTVATRRATTICGFISAYHIERRRLGVDHLTMTTQTDGTSLKQPDATALLIRWLRKPDHGPYGKYGYGVYLPNLARVYLTNLGASQPEMEKRVREMMPMMYAAAWELCRRGILRPGVQAYLGQATQGGAGGDGYSLTPFGQTWLAEDQSDDFVPTEPERFGEMLANHRKRFGAPYQERAQEAVRCYGAHAYLACCTMCGAASESILLATAIAKRDAPVVLALYNTAGGRRKVENLILGQAKEEIRKECTGYLTLLKYWRDEAAHGGVSGVTDNEAFTSLSLLLRLAIFIENNWTQLAESPTS
jgi:hypothetical protein